MKTSDRSPFHPAVMECPSLASEAEGSGEFGPPESVVLPPWLAFRSIVGARRDTPEYVEEVFRRAFSDSCTGAVDRICLSRQVHGNRLERVDEVSGRREDGSRLLRMGECDGLWTSLSGTCLVVRTADCGPIVLWDRRAPRLALVHSGWRGTLGNIVGEALETLKGAGMRACDAAMWIGPMICGRHFEVGNEVRAAFSEKWPEWSMHWSGSGVDLEGMIHRQAILAGVCPEAIYSARRCTYAEARKLPSHRREGSQRLSTLFTLALAQKERGGE